MTAQLSPQAKVIYRKQLERGKGLAEVRLARLSSELDAISTRFGPDAHETTMAAERKMLQERLIAALDDRIALVGGGGSS